MLGISVGIGLALLYGLSWNSVRNLRTSYVAQWISIMMEIGAFIYQFSLGYLIKVAQGLIKITTFLWNIITIVANALIDISLFISIIDGRLAQLGGR